MTEGSSSAWIKAFPSNTLITTNPIWNRLESNPGVPPYRGIRRHVKRKKPPLLEVFILSENGNVFGKEKNPAFVLMTLLKHCLFVSWMLLQLLHSIWFTRLEGFMLFTTSSWDLSILK